MSIIMLSVGKGHSTFHWAKECCSFQQTTQHSRCHYTTFNLAWLQKTGNNTGMAMLAVMLSSRMCSSPLRSLCRIYFWTYSFIISCLSLTITLRFAAVEKVNWAKCLHLGLFHWLQCVLWNRFSWIIKGRSPPLYTHIYLFYVFSIFSYMVILPWLQEMSKRYGSGSFSYWSLVMFVGEKISLILLLDYIKLTDRCESKTNPKY